MPGKKKKQTAPSHREESAEDTPPVPDRQPNGLKLEQAIGLEVRRLRKSVPLTVAELAKASDISPGMLSKIENGQISPSLGTLQMLASALSAPISTFFSTFERNAACALTKAGQGTPTRRRGTRSGHQYRQLGPPIDQSVMVESYLITLDKDSRPATNFQHQGIELIYLLSGEVEYEHASRTYHLGVGDCLVFDSATPHGPAKLLQTPLSYLSVMVYPRT